MSEINVFDEVSVAPDAAVAAPKEAEDKKEKRRKALDRLQNNFKASLQENPGLKDVLFTRSKDIEVVNTLGYGEGGNILADKTAGDRALVSTPVIVGYMVANVSDTPIEYETYAWHRGEDGKYVSEMVTKTLAPHASAPFTRADLTRLTCKAEYSFTLNNGHVTRGSGKDNGNVEDMLACYYFSFNKDIDKQVNSDEVKLPIADKVGDKWVVKPAFEETFGYLNNPVEKARKARKTAEKYSTNALAANLVRRMINGESV